MLDTKPNMQKKQLEIILSKTPGERFIIGAETIDFGRIITESNIKNNNPDILELELKIQILKRYYSTFYSDGEMEKIIKSLKNYYTSENTKEII